MDMLCAKLLMEGRGIRAMASYGGMVFECCNMFVDCLVSPLD